ncbi:granzyme-like protein 2 [Acomys russatus]|uniref:granzyme-like protein 2 n=1 Tax=Acomys russatus TaxID=60746 RepID=UPI0021E246A0|nr:granzyme-like protein 2 [Acomys russatus]
MLLLLVFLVSVLPLSTDGGKIFWGTEVKPHSRPYMAYLNIDRNNSHYVCGGFLVDKDIVMTAAHCNGSHITVTLGAHDMRNKTNTQKIHAIKHVPHEGYTKKKKFNDIMLLKLKRKAQINSFVKTIALPKSEDWVKPGQVCTVSGWGNLANCSSSNTLQEVNLVVQKKQLCMEMSRNYNDSIQLCVGNPNEKKATGSGDSGGPFVCNNVAQGIVSHRFCTGQPPRVFTRISSFIPWIKKTMKLLQQS